MIAPDLKPLCVPIENLSLMLGNPRIGDVEAVKRSYKKFGQRKPIVARRLGIAENGFGSGTVTAGNHQLEAAKALGWTEIAVVFIDEDENTAKAFSLADNRTHDLGYYDDVQLNTLLKEMESFDKDLFKATGYNSNDIEALIDSIDRESGETATKEDMTRGELLSLLNVAYGEPEHLVQEGQIYEVGHHILIVVDVMKDWDRYIKYLKDDILFLPYPGPYIAVSSKLEKIKALFVQPNTYLAGHLLDKYASIYGEKGIKRIDAND